MSEVIVAVFQTVQIADAAQAALEAAGVASASIERFRPDQVPGASHVSTSPEARTGFWAWLRSHHDNAVYEEHITAGRTVMSVHTDSATQANAVVALLSGYAPQHVEAQDDAPPDARLSDRAIKPAGLDAGSPLPGVSDAEQPRNAASTEAEPIRGVNNAVRAHTAGVASSSSTTAVRRYMVEQPVTPAIHNSGFAR